MVKVGVISDTHIPNAAAALPGAVARVFKGVDLILHAGDLVRIDVLDELAMIAPVRAVRGNMDAEPDPLTPDRRIVEVEDLKIGLIHGWGGPNDIHLRVRREFDESVRCVVFGHSHKPFNEKVAGALMFNPGSPTDKRFAPYASLGILTVNGGAVEGEIIKI
ncbi:MAG TPA: metallophosphoesterase [bacterium]|nr:metallophosphoesterase [bacterium]